MKRITKKSNFLFVHFDLPIFFFWIQLFHIFEISVLFIIQIMKVLIR